MVGNIQQPQPPASPVENTSHGTTDNTGSAVQHIDDSPQYPLLKSRVRVNNSDHVTSGCHHAGMNLPATSAS